MTGNRRILIRGVNWLGDSVMSVAAIREIRRLFPAAHVTLLVSPWVAGLFEEQGLVDELCLLRSSSPDWRELKELRHQLRGFDTAILFQNAFRAALMVYLAGIPSRAGYATDGRSLLLSHSARPRIKKLGRHQIYYYLDLLFQSGISPVDYLNEVDFQPDIHLRPTGPGGRGAEILLKEGGSDPGKPFVILNPGAFFGAAKRWFTDRYAALADRLIEEEGVEVAIVGSAGEIAIADEIRQHMRHSPRILTGKTDLPALMGLLSRCRVLITNDSGPMHLASALRVPQVALFGSTDEIATGPWSPEAQVIHKHVECSPCLLRECPIDLRCFSRIAVDEVYEAVRSRMRRD